jgi:hypothetical protein
MQATQVQNLFPTVARITRKTELDADLLKVEHNVKPPSRRLAHVGKYHDLFSTMRPGSCVRCESEEVNTIASALRSQIKLGKYPALKDCKVSAFARCEDGHARVWALKV